MEARLRLEIGWANVVGTVQYFRTWSKSGCVVVLIFGGGWVLAQTGDAIAQQTNLGAGFVGAALGRPPLLCPS